MNKLNVTRVQAGASIKGLLDTNTGELSELSAGMFVWRLTGEQFKKAESALLKTKYVIQNNSLFLDSVEAKAEVVSQIVK